MCILTCLAAFTRLRDPWTNEANHREACQLLPRLLDSLPKSELETRLAQILQQRVKPAFAKTRNPNLTQQSRKAIDPLPIGDSMVGNDIESKPWKYQNMYIPTVLQWVLQQTVGSKAGHSLSSMVQNGSNFSAGHSY